MIQKGGVCVKTVWNSPSNSAAFFAGTLTQAIRNFAKSLEGWLMNAMSEFPPQIVQTKVSRESMILNRGCVLSFSTVIGNHCWSLAVCPPA